MTPPRRSARRALALTVARRARRPIHRVGRRPPTVETSPADSSLLSDTYALISGVVNPGGTAASYQFEWGETTAYGQITPLTSAGNGKADVPVDYSLDELKPRTTYHYRLVAIPKGSTAPIVGADQSFKTSRSLAVSVVGHKVKPAKNGKTTFLLKAVGPPETTATGIVTVKTVIGKSKQTISAKHYSVATGKTKTVSVTLPASVRNLLGTEGHPKVHLLVRAKTVGVKAAVVKSLRVGG